VEGWRIGRILIVAGGVGMVVGARSETGSVALPLLVLGLAAWHFWAWGRGKHFRASRLGTLVAIGLLATLALGFTQYDFRDGTPELDAREWLGTASLAVLLVGVLWSFVELIRSRERRSQDRTAIP
jgi:hypothetical protein